MCLSRNIELFLVCLPALLNSSHYRLVLRIGTQIVVVLVALEPRVIHISEGDCPLEPIEGTLPVAKRAKRVRALAYKSSGSGTGSNPPFTKGLHRPSRFSANHAPRRAPCFCTASCA